MHAITLGHEVVAQRGMYRLGHGAECTAMGAFQLVVSLGRGNPPRARGWAASYTDRSRSADTLVYTCVVDRVACPNSSWTTRRSAP